MEPIFFISKSSILPLLFASVTPLCICPAIVSPQMTVDYLVENLIKNIDEKLSRPNDQVNLVRMSEIIRLLRNPTAEKLAKSLSLPYNIPMSTKCDQIVHSSLMSSFLEVDSEVSRLGHSGSTAVVTVLYKQPRSQELDLSASTTASNLPIDGAAGKEEFKLMVAGTGDSFALLGKLNGPLQPKSYGSSQWESVVLYREHKPEEPEELSRIKKAGGFVTYTDHPRLNDDLTMSRAFNDNHLKPFGLIVDPDIFCFSLENICQTPFLVIGSDGVLESLSHQMIIDIVGRGYLKGKTASQTSRDLVDSAAPRSRDNITAMVIYLKPPPSKQ